jgi:hypothetical protein
MARTLPKKFWKSTRRQFYRFNALSGSVGPDDADREVHIRAAAGAAEQIFNVAN